MLERLHAIATVACKFAAAMLLIILAVLAWRAVAFVDTATKTVASLPRLIDARAASIQHSLTAQISRVVDGDPESGVSEDMMSLRHLLTSEVDTQIGALRNTATGQIDALRKDLIEGHKSVVGLLNARVGDTLARVDTALGTVESLRGDLRPTLQNMASVTKNVNDIAAHVDSALPQFTDCAYLDENGIPIGGNPDCLFNRFQGTSKAIEQMARDGSKMANDIQKAVPKIADSVVSVGESGKSVAANVAREVDEATRPKRWYQKILGPAYTIGRLVAAFM